MADNTSNTNQNTKPKTKEEKSKKRRFGGQQEGTRKKRKLNFETDLTKERNIILCSCQKYKEKSCGRALKLVFSEYIEEFLKENDNKPSNKDNKATNEQDEQDEDDDIKIKPKPTSNDNKNDKKENDDIDIDIDENKQPNEDEDDDLKVNNKINNTISISDAINDELANLNKNEVCEWIQGPDGLVIIDILNKNVKASKLVQFVFDKFHPKRPILSPFVYKLYPLDTTTFSRCDDMIKLAGKVIQESWDKISKEDAYAINYKNRGNKKLDRKTIIDGIASFVPPGYKVDLSNPKTVILLQTFGRTAGISIITNGTFTKHKEYNLGKFEG